MGKGEQGMSVEENLSSSQTGETPAESSAELASSSSAPADAEIGELLAGIEETSGIAPGQVVKGTVLKVTDEEVFVDIGVKSEFAIPRGEFVSGDGHLTIKPGDTVDVWVEEYDEAEGTFTVSHQKAARWRAWDDLERAFREQKDVSARVLERTKGGLTVEIDGVRAFLPGSQSDIRPLRDPDALVGQQIACKVIKLNKSRNNVVVSRRLALEEEVSKRKAELLEQLAEGKVLTGRVKNLTSYGAFVDLGGMDGLLHVTDLSWGRVAHPGEILQVGQELRVKVLKYDAEKGRVSLGLKQLDPDPWERVPSTYRPGDRVAGRVVNLADYGAFVELEPGVEGLIHVSEMSWSRRLKHPSKILKVGDRVDVSVLDVSSSQHRISLSLKEMLPDPWSTLAERLAAGTRVEGRVRNITDFGAFVEIEEGVDVLIHVSDLSWDKNVRHASEVLKKGQKVEGVILSLDLANRRISMGIKQLQQDIWEGFFSTTKVGDTLHGKVVRMPQFGAFVELKQGIVALCHVSEMEERHTGKGPDCVQVGKEFDFRVVRLNPAEKRIGLSLKGVEARSEAASATEPAPKAPAKPERSLSPFAAAMRAALTGWAAAPATAETPVARTEPPSKAGVVKQPLAARAPVEQVEPASPETLPRVETTAVEFPSPSAVAGGSSVSGSPRADEVSSIEPLPSPRLAPPPATLAAAVKSSPPSSPPEAADTKGEEAQVAVAPQATEAAARPLSNAGLVPQGGTGMSSSGEPRNSLGDRRDSPPAADQPGPETPPAQNATREE
jgi:small subunit ribosomal protein S1